MKSIAALGLIFALTGLPATPAQANPMTDICQARAKSVSGYSGTPSGLTWQSGKVRLRLSGSARVGVTYSSGKGLSSVKSIGEDRGEEQRQERAERKYSQVYNACIKNG